MIGAELLALLQQANMFVLGFACASGFFCLCVVAGSALHDYFERRRRVLIARARQTRVPAWPVDEGRHG